MSVVEVRWADRELWPALEELFGRNGASNGCWCMYWLVGAEYHHRPRDRNRSALRRAAVAGPSPGLLALDGAGLALGWARLTPRDELAWLAHKRFLAPVDDLEVWSLPCFYIRRTHRRQGVMAALIDAAVEYARGAGVSAVEAYPVDASVPGSTRNIFPGTVAAFARAGFTEVARRRDDRPVLRHPLAAS